MKKIKVEVSKQDIEVGTRGEPDCCPIAWALERKDFKEIYVSDAYVNFEDEKGNLITNIIYHLKTIEVMGWDMKAF
jgi:hypothetical protein